MDKHQRKYVLENQIEMSEYSTRQLKQKYYSFFGREYFDPRKINLCGMDWFVVGMITGVLLYKFLEITLRVFGG